MPAETAPQHNQQPYSVSEISGAIKGVIESNFERVRVRGELTGWKIASSGHVYPRLKDERACIDAVMWRGTLSRLTFRPEDGLEVIATGKLTTYPGRSNYQLVIEDMEIAGEGALMALLEQRKRALAAEGLFDVARKQKLPYLPEVIGIVTSPSGAVIRDILHRLQDRFPRPVLLWPVPVQGEGAAEKIAAAIRGFNALPTREELRAQQAQVSSQPDWSEHSSASPLVAAGVRPMASPEGRAGANATTLSRPSVLIVARGGGSIEDLWCFNEEVVVRAVAESQIPVISGVGHEPDVTLIDHVADMRAPTPTGAAELAVPVLAECRACVHDFHGRVLHGWARLHGEHGRHLLNLARALPRADQLLAQAQQRLDGLADQLPRALKTGASKHGEPLQRIAAKLHPSFLLQRLERGGARLASCRQQADAFLLRRVATQDTRLARLTPSPSRLRHTLAQQSERMPERARRLDGAFMRRIEQREAVLQRLEAKLEGMDYKRILARGYALVQDDAGQVVASAEAARKAGTLRLTFADGMLPATTGEAATQPASAPARKPAPAKAAGQASLFDQP